MTLPAFATPTPPSALDALRAFAAGTLTPAGYLAACEARAAECEPWLHAFAHRPRDLAAPAGGPFGGLPFGVKDIIDTADMPTGNGAAADRGRVPGRDAWVVERLRSLGGVVFGKTVTTEYAWRHPGATVNPHDRAHTPGGSSSGSAAAVAAGIVPLALGTQTVGSVIRPAAYCGVIGLKPSYGAIPRTGVHPLAGSLDHVGVFARRVEDVAFALGLLAAASGSDPHGTPLPAFSVDPRTGLRDATPGTGAPRTGTSGAGAPGAGAPRLALVRTERWDGVEAPQREALEHAAARLRASGAQVHELALPAGFAGVWDWAQTLLAVEAAAIHRERIARVPDRVSATLKALASAGEAVPASAYVEALGQQRALRHRLGEVLSGFDAVLTMPATGTAPRGLDLTGDASPCAPWTFLGAPAVTLPVATAANGLPLGIQLVGRYREDLRLLETAAWAEAALA